MSFLSEPASDPFAPGTGLSAPACKATLPPAPFLQRVCPPLEPCCEAPMRPGLQPPLMRPLGIGPRRAVTSQLHRGWGLPLSTPSLGLQAQVDDTPLLCSCSPREPPGLCLLLTPHIKLVSKTGSFFQNIPDSPWSLSAFLSPPWPSSLHKAGWVGFGSTCQTPHTLSCPEPTALPWDVS